MLLLTLLLALQEPMKVGIIGTDTSHVTAFTRLLNDEKGKDHVPGCKVVAAFKGGSPDIEASAGRVEKFAAELKEKWGVEIVDSIPALCAKVDVVLLESVDGRPHLEQVRPVFAAKKRVFIDKPLAGSLKDAREIARLSKESGTPFFTASSVRYYETMIKARDAAVIGQVKGAEAFAPSPIEKSHPDLFWYGIHGVEALYSAMGPGCESVTRVHTDGTDVVVGRWKDGRIGAFRGIRAGKQTYGLTVFGDKAVQSSTALQGRNDYRALVVEIVKFFKSGESPVPVEEMLEVLAFMEAADRSKAQGGAPVPVDVAK
jgi:predicted dehydrogenase